MKETWIDSATVFTTEYKIPDNIHDEIYKKVKQFCVKFGKEPKGIILGPNEYIALIEILRDRFTYTDPRAVRLGYIKEFVGLPVRVKTTKGIDLEIEQEDFYIHAKGISK